MNTRLICTLAGVAVLTLTTAAPARTKLTTLPERETVRVDIQNGRYTLVEEERTVNLQAGRNQVDFSWANINIDKESIVFRVIRADGEVHVLNTNYPPNENALYWIVSAEKAGPAVIPRDARRTAGAVGDRSCAAEHSPGPQPPPDPPATRRGTRISDGKERHRPGRTG